MPSKRWQAVVAGIGGQGVLFATRILANAAMQSSGRVLISEVHGMAQRGGSVVSHLKAGDFSSPLVNSGDADLVLSLDAGEAIRNIPFLAPGAALVVNAPDIGFLSRDARDILRNAAIRLAVVDASAASRAVGAPRSANVVLVAYASASGMLPYEPSDIYQVIVDITSPARLDMNKRLIKVGSSIE